MSYAVVMVRYLYRLNAHLGFMWLQVELRRQGKLGKTPSFNNQESHCNASQIYYLNPLVIGFIKLWPCFPKNSWNI